MSEPFVGMICIFGFDYNPYKWLPCRGQLISIQQYSVLFSLLGTQYGGNGTTTFALPDFRGRAPVSMQAGSNANAGIQAGFPTATLMNANLPAHNHLINASSETGDVAAPNGAYRASTGVFDKEYKATASSTVPMNALMVGDAGSGTSFSIMQPSLAVNYCIALEGVFPPFN